MKYSQWIGLLALALLILSCFLPWTYYPDIQKTFTGFFSENNLYGKPGKAIVILAVLSGVCFIVPRIWAKRIHFFLSAVIVAYAFRSFIIFASCYRGICPEKKGRAVADAYFRLRGDDHGFYAQHAGEEES